MLNIQRQHQQAELPHNVSDASQDRVSSQGHIPYQQRSLAALNQTLTETAGKRDEASLLLRIEAHLDKGDLLAQRGQHKEALGAYQEVAKEVIQLSADARQSTPVLTAQVRTNLQSGHMLQAMNEHLAAMGKYDAVIQSFEQSGLRQPIPLTDAQKTELTEGPAAQAHLASAISAEKLGKHDKASEHLKQAYIEHPQTPQEYQQNIQVARREENIASKVGESKHEAHQNKLEHQEAAIENNGSNGKMRKYKLLQALGNIGTKNHKVGDMIAPVVNHSLKTQASTPSKTSIPTVVDMLAKVIANQADKLPSSIRLIDGDMDKTLMSQINNIVSEAMKDSVFHEEVDQISSKMNAFGMLTLSYQTIMNAKEKLEELPSADEAIGFMQSTMQALSGQIPSRQDTADLIITLLNEPKETSTEMLSQLGQMARKLDEFIIQEINPSEGLLPETAVDVQLMKGQDQLEQGLYREALESFKEAETLHQLQPFHEKQSEKMQHQLSDIHLGAGAALLGTKSYKLAENRFNQILNHHDKQQEGVTKIDLLKAFFIDPTVMDTKELTLAKATKGLAMAKELEAELPMKTGPSKNQLNGNVLALYDKSIIQEPSTQDDLLHNIEVHMRRKKVADKLQFSPNMMGQVDKDLQSAKELYQQKYGVEDKVSIDQPKNKSSKPPLATTLLTKALMGIAAPKRPEKKLDPLVDGKAFMANVIDPSSHTKVSIVPSRQEIFNILSNDDKTANAIHRVVDGLMSKGSDLVAQLVRDPLVKNALERLFGEEGFVNLSATIETALAGKELYQEKGMEGIKEFAVDIANELLNSFSSTGKQVTLPTQEKDQPPITNSALASLIAKTLVESVGEEIYQQLPSKAQVLTEAKAFTQESASYIAELAYDSALSATGQAVDAANYTMNATYQLASDIINQAWQGVSNQLPSSQRPSADQTLSNQPLSQQLSQQPSAS